MKENRENIYEHMNRINESVESGLREIKQNKLELVHNVENYFNIQDLKLKESE
jgi:hypothetical protein